MPAGASDDAGPQARVSAQPFFRLPPSAFRLGVMDMSQVHTALKDMERMRMGNGSAGVFRAVMHQALSAGAASTLAVTRGPAYS